MGATKYRSREKSQAWGALAAESSSGQCCLLSCRSFGSDSKSQYVSGKKAFLPVFLSWVLQTGTKSLQSPKSVCIAELIQVRWRMKMFFCFCGLVQQSESTHWKQTARYLSDPVQSSCSLWCWKNVPEGKIWIQCSSRETRCDHFVYFPDCHLLCLRSMFCEIPNLGNLCTDGVQVSSLIDKPGSERLGAGLMRKYVLWSILLFLPYMGT